MGYYSDVALTLKRNDMTNLVRQAKEDEDVLALLDLAELYDQKECMTLVWRFIKWYDYNPSVRWIVNKIYEMDDYLFLCIGEEYDDIKTEWAGDGDLWEYCDISREFNLADGKKCSIEEVG